MIGQEFGIEVLSRLYPHPELLDATLQTLMEREFVHQIRVYPERVYRFRHVITGSVQYESVVPKERKALHLRVGEILEALYEDRLEEQVESLAHHCRSSSEPERAIEFLQRAGDKAAILFSLLEARTHFRSAIELLDGFKMNDDQRRQRIDLSLKLAGVSFYSPSPELVATLEKSREDSKALGDAGRTANATFWSGFINYGLGNYTLALELFSDVHEWFHRNMRNT